MKVARIVVVTSALGSLSACTESDVDCNEFFEGGMSVSQVYRNAAGRGFSGNILVRARGEVLLNESAGSADRASAIPMSTDTLSPMGSITKQYTGALILSLQEASLLSVEDTLADHFVDVPPDKANISIHQLLVHGAGFPASLGADLQPIGREDYLKLAWSTPLQFEPGTDFGYSNTGYSIAAALAEGVTGQTYEAALDERILTPALIHDTGYVIPDWSGRVFASGYARESTVDVDDIRLTWQAEGGPYWNLRGNGGLLTTTDDLLKWHDALAGEDVLTARSIEALQERNVVRGSAGVYYGYGWNTRDTPAGDLHWHDGSNGHHFAAMRRFVDEDLVIVMLANETNDASRCLPSSLARASSPALADWAGP